MEALWMKQWSPYIVGIAIGLLNCIAFIVSDKYIGCSAAFSRTSGMLERMLRGRKILQKSYYIKFMPVIDWEWMLVAGIAAGAFLSAHLSGQLRADWVPALWASAFGPGAPVRLCIALAGGIIMGLGARWAGGCTSGHGISGTMQLAVSSWLAALCFFISGIGTAMLIFRVL